jgi:hypothetical protein
MQGIEDEVKKEHKNKKIRLMFCDEARFGLMEDKSGCWAPSGFRPEVLISLRRQYTYAYSAVSPKDGRIVSLMLPYANTESMNVFLAEVSRSFPDDYNVLWADQAGWHKSKDLEIPDNIRLEFLPPYSPQLNPTEHVWDELREKHFKNRYFKDLEQLEEQLCTGLKNLQDNPKIVAKTTGFSWILKAALGGD